MEKTEVSSPMFDIYSWVAKACLKLWPLCLVQLLFLILQYATLFTCLALLFGPFAARNLDRITEGLSHPQDYDWTPVISDWASTFSDPGWLAIAAGLLLLYITWWCVLSALSDGGVFRTFWDYFQNGRPFSWGSFFWEAIHWMIPMLWLEFFLSLWAFGAFLVWLVVVLVVTGILALTGFNVWMVVLAGVLLGLPSILIWILFSLAFAVFSFLCKACLTQGMTAREAIHRAFLKFKADRWRVGLGLLVAFLVYLGVSIFLRVVLKLFSLIPFAGIFFSLLDLALGIGLTLFMVVYISGLAVGYLQDEARV